MTQYRLLAPWLRPLVGLFALAGMLLLSACGGGNGAPNNPYAPGPSTPPPLTVLPIAATIYSGVPSTLTVTGGISPYRAFSSDSTILPVSQSVAGNTVLLLAANVGSAVNITITIQDAVGTTVSAAIVVSPAPLLPSLITITPNGDCAGTNNLCSGGTGTATVVETGPGGAGIPGRQVRFDVVAGSYAIQTTNPAQPLASTLTVVSDAFGSASVGIAVNVNATTQIATIRATDVMTGNQVTGNFTIQQVTDGSLVLSIVPTGNVTIEGPSATTCSSGVTVAYYIYGGTPPYQVAATFPQVVSLSGVPVATNGGSFTATTNGACFLNMQYAITDASGRTLPGGSSPTLTNKLGTSTAAPPATTLTVSPAAVTNPACTGKTFTFIVVGGTAPYNVSASPSSGVIIAPSPVPTAGTPVSVSGLLTGSGVTTITFVDASTPTKLVATGSIDCK